MTAAPEHATRPRRWVRFIAAALLGLLALAVGGGLGAWQWDRAHRQSAAVEPEPRASIADVMRPGEAGAGEGRLVSVDGTWAELPVGLVTGKEIEGVPAVLLIRPLAVDADATGTGAPATLAVLAGWLPASGTIAPPQVGDAQTVTGYVRGGEGIALAPETEPVEGAVWEGSISTASLAQVWPSPVYSYLVVADRPAPGWNAIPAPQQQRRLDLRSATYAIEWWVFGVFGAFLAARSIRDNGAKQPQEESS